MASDDFNWDDDPFGGDLDFNDDFDSPSKKKGFLRSAATGFLSGLVGNTVGSTDAKIQTLQSVLPKTFGGAFTNLSIMNAQRKEMMEDLKNESADTVKDLQYFAKRASARLGKDAPNRISTGLASFSEKDFSGWEKPRGESSDKLPGMEGLEDGAVDELLKNEDANSLLERETSERIGRQTIGMISEVGGRSVAGINTLNRSVLKSNQLLEQLVHHQRKVKSKQDALQLSVLARTYLTNVKFYKFMEASQHRQITELKDLAKFSKMSDYEKTSTSQAVRKNLRDGFFSTVASRAGGVGSFFKDKFGKDARSEAAGNVSEMTSSVRMAMEMSEGMPMDYGNMLGDALSKLFISKLPAMIESGRGQQFLRTMESKYPKQAKQFRDAYKKMSDMGNVATYLTGNLEEIGNSLAANYQGGDWDDGFDTYEDYVDNLKPGEKKLPKLKWQAFKTVKGVAKKGVNTILEGTSVSRGTSYSIKSRTIKDSFEQSLWTKRSDRTLNEEIPRWLSEIHLSLEKTRTGNDKLSAQSYDYSKARFIGSKEKSKHVLDAVLDKSSYQRQASVATGMVGNIDKNKALSKAAQNELAFQLAKQADRGMGFNPYNLIALEKQGVSANVAAEIRTVIQGEFGVTNEDITRFNEGTDMDRLSLMSHLPTEEARSRVVSLADSAKSLKGAVPDVSETLDMLKGSGYYDALKASGIITVDKNGREEVNKSLLDKTLRGYINDDKYESSNSLVSDPSVLRNNMRKRNRKSIRDEEDTFSADAESVNAASENSLRALSELAPNLKEFSSTMQSMAGGLSFDISPLTTEAKEMNAKLSLLIESATARNDLLHNLLIKPPGKVKINPDTGEMEEGEDKAVAKEKKGVLERLKKFSLKGTFDKGFDKLLSAEPMMLGSLLGGLAGVAAFNPKAAALMAGGGAAVLAYSKLRQMASAKQAADTEDLYEEGSVDPILEAWKLKQGHYFDIISKKVLDSWEGIKGAVKDTATGVTISAKRLSAKLFTAENKEVFIKGLAKVKKMAIDAFNFIDPFGKAKKFGNAVRNRLFQMDVYKQGAKDPTLFGKSFAGGAYFKRDENGKFIVLNGWNEIDGPVYNREQVPIITQEDFDAGLVTSMGVSVNKMGDFAKKAAGAAGGLLGKLKDKASGAGRKAADGIKGTFKNDYAPIVNSVDRIFNLLIKKWGMDSGDFVNSMMGDDGATITNPDGTKISPTVTNPSGVKKKGIFTGLGRLNSIEDMARKEREAKDEKVKDSLIKLGENFGGAGENDEEKKEGGTGLFGLLKKGFGALKGFGAGLLGFMTGPMWGVLSTLGSFAVSGLKLLPMIASGIWAMAKGAGNLLGDGYDILRGNPRRNRKGPGGRKPGGRRMGGKMLGAGLAIGAASYGLQKFGLIEEDGMAADGLDMAATAATVYGTAAMLLPGTTAAVTAAAGSAATAVGTGAVAAGSAAWGLMAPLLFNPVTLGILAVGAIGYGVYKYMKRGAGKQIEIRLTQYGVADKDDDLAEKMLKLEGMLKDHVIVSGGRASLAKTAPLQEAIKSMITDQSSEEELRNVFVWFNNRFKPVFLVHHSVLANVGITSLEDYDANKTMTVYNVAKQIQEALSSIVPHPYSVVTVIDKKSPLLDERQTVGRITNLMIELKEYVERNQSASEKQPAELMTAPKAAEDEKKDLEATLNKEGGLWNNTFNPFSEKGEASSKLKKLEEETKLLNKIYAPGGVLAKIDIKDLLKEGETLDMFTAVRLSAYGNDKNIPWRVEAVLKLERYCESLFTITGKEVKFTGEVGALYSMFKDAFRISPINANRWCMWFRDRFLPVLTTYMTSLQKYRRGRPLHVWKSLSATARYEIARDIIDTQAEVKPGKFLPIWTFGAAPFDRVFSLASNTQALRMLNALSTVSEQAKLKDPLKEAEATQFREANAREKEEQAKAEKQKANAGPTQASGVNGSSSRQPKTALAGAFGTNLDGSPAAYSQAGPAPNFKRLDAYASDYGALDLTSVVKNAGDDKGVKTPPKLAEKLIMREMLAQGFTDPREIAMVLAQAKVESGNFSQTVENMRYTNPESMVKLFREVKTMAQAQALIKAGPQAIANTVYGGGKGRELGNHRPGDGWMLRGRGWLQTTGGNNYIKTGNDLGIDLLNNPKLLSEDPSVMAKAAVNFYKNNKMMRSIAQGAPFSKAGRGINPSGPPEMGARERHYNEYLNKLTKGELTADEGEFASEIAKVEGSGGSPTTPPPSETGGTILSEGAKNSVGILAAATPPPTEQINRVDNAAVAAAAAQAAQASTASAPSQPTPSQMNQSNVVGLTTPVKNTPTVNNTPISMLPPQQGSQDLSKVSEDISAAVLSTGGQQTALLQGMIAQLAELNKNLAKTPETVRLG